MRSNLKAQPPNEQKIGLTRQGIQLYSNVAVLQVNAPTDYQFLFRSVLPLAIETVAAASFFAAAGFLVTGTALTVAAFFGAGAFLVSVRLTTVVVVLVLLASLLLPSASGTGAGRLTCRLGARAGCFGAAV